MRLFISLLVCCLLCWGQLPAQVQGNYMPNNGKTMLMMGQFKPYIGGFPCDPGDGDCDGGYIGNISSQGPNLFPAGITLYGGITNPMSGSTTNNAERGTPSLYDITSNPLFDDAIIHHSLGFVIGDNETFDKTLNGDYDEACREYAQYILSLAPRPVFIRIGYEVEFHYGGMPSTVHKYKYAFRHLVNILRCEGAYNAVTVWNPFDEPRSGYVTVDQQRDFLMRYYPGDEYVDWVSFDMFGYNIDTSHGINELVHNGQGAMAIAQESNKPVMICESSFSHHGKGTRLDAPGAESQWYWFEDYFQLIQNHSNQIKAVAYITDDWDAAHSQFAGWGDSRVWVNPTIKQNWINEVSNSNFWQHSANNLFSGINPICSSWSPNISYANSLNINSYSNNTTNYGDYFYKVNNWIQQSAGIQNGAVFEAEAGHEITLKPGFHAEHGSYYHAHITGACGVTSISNSPDDMPQADDFQHDESQLVKTRNTYQSNQLKVYPNPTLGLFTLQMQQALDVDAEVVISDFTGRLVRKFTLNKLTEQMNIDLTEEPDGVYILNLIGPESHFTTRVIKNGF